MTSHEDQSDPSTAAARPKQDSESSLQQLSYAGRAASWAEDIRSRPLDDAHAIELAKVFALLAIHEQLDALRTGLEKSVRAKTTPKTAPRKPSTPKES